MSAVRGAHPSGSLRLCNMAVLPCCRTLRFEPHRGEGGIRTHETLPFTHFPGVLLRPLGHLTVIRHFSRSGERALMYSRTC